MILEGVDSEEEDYQIHMLRENEIPGLLKTDVRYVDNVSQYYYDISGKVSFKAMHEKVNLKYEEMNRLVNALLQTMKTIRKYMLDGDGILLDPEYIFCSREQFFFCYYPGGKTVLREEFHRLTEYFVSEVDYKEKEGMQFAYRIHKATMEQNYSMEQIMKELAEEQEQEKEVKTLETVRYDERMEERVLEEDMIAEKKERWEPVRRILERKKKVKWGDWNDIYIEEDDL